MGVAEKGMARQKEGPDLITPRNKRKGLRNKNFDLIKSCSTVFLFIFICRVNLAYSKSQHPLHDWLIHFFVPRSVRVHWNKQLPPLHTLLCFVSFGTQLVDGNWKYSFYQPAQLGSNSSLSWYAASEEEIKHTRTQTVETMQIRRKGDQFSLI